MERESLQREIVHANIRYGYLKFGMQSGISLVAIAFSAAMIATNEDVEGIYLPLITAIVGFWLPAPAFPINHDATVPRAKTPRAPPPPPQVDPPLADMV
jgi:hypothetical protein